jgi:hypothetical protein
MKTYRDIIQESREPISELELKPGFTFFVLSANGRSMSKYKITGAQELNVGTVLKVKHTVLAGDKFKQDVISKDHVLGRQGSLKVFRTRKQAMDAFKRGGARMTEAGYTSRAMNPSESDAEVIVSYSDLNGRTGMKSFKTRKSFDKWFSKNEGKVRIIDYIKDRD